MRVWALILRFLGFAWFVWVFIANLRTLLEPYVILEIELDFRLTAAENIVQAAVTAALCFGVASGLEALARMENRISSQNAAPPRSMPPAEKQQPVKRDVAARSPWDLPGY